MIITTNRNIQKFDKCFERLATKLLKKLDVKTYFNTFTKYTIPVCLENKDLIVTSNNFCNISARKTIVDTLKEIDYKRGNSNWSEKVVIGFMDEVINLYLYEHDGKIIDSESKKISKRYNVPINRLKTQVALFIINLHRERDSYNLLSYFSPYELIIWEYRDKDKLQKSIEDGSLKASDKKLLQDLGIIE